ncbi:protein son of sevenless [Anaeramoeba ignava]|uniref:Protein son of sevenless n=1 Tax=Anaeramoeba ignava TaxID=1746090 RepID=A0A9Q0R753_ANAIG|nr:protein son of sevenless [Anaeramoeba ignava]
MDFDNLSHDQLLEFAKHLIQENQYHQKTIVDLNEKILTHENQNNQLKLRLKQKIQKLVSKNSNLKLQIQKLEWLKGHNHQLREQLKNAIIEKNELKEKETSIEENVFSRIQDQINVVILQRDSLRKENTFLREQIDKKENDFNTQVKVTEQLQEMIREREIELKSEINGLNDIIMNKNQFIEKSQNETETYKKDLLKQKKDLEEQKKSSENEIKLTKERMLLLVQQRNYFKQINALLTKGEINEAVQESNKKYQEIQTKFEKLQNENNELQQLLQKAKSQPEEKNYQNELEKSIQNQNIQNDQNSNQNLTAFENQNRQALIEIVEENKDLRNEVSFLSQEKIELENENLKYFKQVENLQNEITSLTNNLSQIIKEKQELFTYYMEKDSQMRLLQIHDEERQERILESNHFKFIMKEQRKILTEISKEKEILKENYDEVLLDLASIKTTLSEKLRELTRLSRQYDDLNYEKNGLIKNNSQLEKKYQELQEKQREFPSDNLKNTTNQERFKEENEQSLLKQLEEEKKKVTQFENEASSLRKKLEIRKRKYKELSRNCEDLLKSNENYKNEIMELKVDMEMIKLETTTVVDERDQLVASFENERNKYEKTIELLKKLDPLRSNTTSKSTSRTLVLIEKLLDSKDEVVNRTILELEDPKCLTFKQRNNEIYVRSGTIQKLVELLGNATNKDQQYLMAFLITCRVFSKASNVLDHLYASFKEAYERASRQNPNDANKQQSDLEYTQKRFATFAFFWVKIFFSDFEQDPDLVKKMLEFLEFGASQTQFPGVKRIIEETRSKFNNKLKGGIETDEVFQAWNKSADFPESFVPKKFSNEFDIIVLRPVEAARQITLIEKSLFQKIRAQELLRLAWTKNGKEKKSPNVLEFIHHSNKISAFIVHQIVKHKSPKMRANVIRFAIELLDELEHLNNFNGMMEILASLNHACIYRLKKTWEKITEIEKKKFRMLASMMSHQSGYKHYRAQLEKRKSLPLVPFIGVLLTDLTFIEEGNPDSVDGLIHFYKFFLAGKAINSVLAFQEKSYDVRPVESIQNYFLSNIQVPLSESQLYQISLQNEPKEANNFI